MIETPVPGLEAARAEVEPLYREYIGLGFDAGYVISVETAAYALALARHMGATRVADFGTGFTSVVMGLHASQVGGMVDSVDSSVDWAIKTKHALRWFKLPDEGVLPWGAWSASGRGGYDLVVYDYSVGQEREDGMAPATAALRPGGAILFDDAQHGTHNLTAHRAVEGRGGQMINLAPWTSDGFGRWALLGILPQ